MQPPPEPDEGLSRRYLRSVYRSEVLRVWLPAVCLVTVLVGGMGVLLLRSQQHSRVALEERYSLRAALASRFVTSYVTDIQGRESAQARGFLADRVVPQRRFELVSRAFGFDAAVLLDSHGRALNILPAKPELIGKRLDLKYAHLRAAVAGQYGVSDVVPSAARGVPIVALAVPFASPFGFRVFSGGVSISQSPLKSFLRDSMPFKQSRAYLIDAKGNVIVAGGTTAATLALPPHTHGTSGAIAVAGTHYRFASEPVEGTTWRLLTLAPASQLYAPLQGRAHWIPWIALLALALASATALGLFVKLLRSRAVLTHLATHDHLTGAVNRRTFERAFQRLAAAARRSGTAVGVLAVDLDRFKNVNDIHGHAAGDELLRRVAETLQTTVRPSDIVARLGGDEFAVLLAEVTEQQAHEIAARVVQTLNAILFPVFEDIELRANCSVGIALASDHDLIDDVLKRADGALYEAKSVGRNTWRAAPAT